MVHTRAGGKSRRVTIGRHGVWTPERARREAGKLIASLKAGETPRRPGADSPSATGPTVAEVAERYMTEHMAVRCKPTTQRACRHILDKFLLPRFGGLRLSEVTPDHVAALHYRLHDKPTMANQVVSLLSRLFYTAAKSGEAPAGGNPCRFIQKYPTRSRERFLSEQEFDRLGRVLADLETRGTISTSAAAALRLLMLTGCRRNEVVTLRWEHTGMRLNEVLPLRWRCVDLAELVFRVEETKMGAPLELPITRQLATILKRRLADGGAAPGTSGDWVFPSILPGALGHIADLSHLYGRIGEAGGTRFWYHGLRNVFITVAERDLLLPHALTRRLVNHAPPNDVTEGYAADWTIGQLREPAQRIADRIEALMDRTPQT